jgi:NAD+ synthetase
MSDNAQFKIAIAQINPKTADVKGNFNKILSYASKAADERADVVLFGNLALCGGFCYDLFLMSDFVSANAQALEQLKNKISVPAFLGSVISEKSKQVNAVMYLDKEDSAVAYRGANVFQSKYFRENYALKLIEISDRKIVCATCSDHQEIYAAASRVKKQFVKIDMLFVFSASPFYKNKPKEFKETAAAAAKVYGLDIVFVNLVGAQDGYVFDGASFAVSKDGNFKAVCKSFEEDFVTFSFQDEKNVTTCELSKEAAAYEALKLGLKDYCAKNNFKHVTLGVSGGADSALTLVIAADALGAQNVTGVFMPSAFTSKQSRSDAGELCRLNNVKLLNFSIAPLFEGYKIMFKEIFQGKQTGIAEENLQARIRCNILMALSNKFGWLVLGTSNKSELACGFGTLYGDMSGGYGVLYDVDKTFLYKLIDYRNSISEVIPETIIKREPTAELRENQKDTDTLPEYSTLDKAIKQYELKLEGKTVEDKEIDATVEKMILKSEYKRRQAAIGTRITEKAFVKDIILPVTDGYK